MHRHLRRLASFATIGGFIFLLNIAVVQLFVTVLGFNPIVVYPFALAVGITIDYLLNRRITWNDRDLELRRSASRFAILHIATAGVEYGLFAVFVHLGLIVLAAQIAAGSVSGTLNFLATHNWAFTTSKSEEAASVG